MSYEINGDKMIRSFSLPMWVVEKSLSLATPNALKLLMVIFSDTSALKTPEQLSELLNIKLSDVREGLEFWVGEGVLKDNEQQNSPIKEGEQIQALRQQLVSQKQSYTPNEVMVILKENPELSDVRDMAEGIKGKPLSRSELNDIAVLRDHYGLSVHFILTVIGYCHEIGKKDLKTVRSTAEAFFINGIDEDTIDCYVKEKLEYYLSAHKIKILLGLQERHFKDRELKLLEGWKTVLHMSDEMIKYAFEVSIEDNKGAVSVSYTNGILERWAKQGISTVVQAQDDTQKFRNQSNFGGKSKKKTESKTPEKTSSIYQDIESLVAAQMEEPW